MISEKFPEISKAWILTGEGVMYPGAETNSILNQIIGIPFYHNFPKNRPPAEPDKILYFSKELLDNPDFATRCNTNELLPLYKTDAVIFLRRWSMKNPLIYGEVYFIVTDYCSVFRIIRKVKDIGKVYLVSLNKDSYDDFVINSDDINELYIVV